MRYFKPTAFLLLTLSGLGSLLPRAAMAASEETEVDTLSVAESAPPAAADDASLIAGNEPILMVKSINLPSLLKGAQENSNRALLAQATEPSFSNPLKTDDVVVAIEQAAAKPMTLKEFKEATRSDSPSHREPLLAPERPTVETDKQIVPVISQTLSQAVEDDASEELPSLNTEPIAPPEVPEAPPMNSAPTEPTLAAPTADLGNLPDILFADPNPLNVPSSEAEIDVDLNPVVTLEEAVELAYRNNQTLQSAVLSLEQADAAVDEAKASRLPTANLGSNLTRNQQGGENNTTLDGTFQVNYDLFTGGARDASIRAAELQREVSVLIVESQQEQLRLVTANLYYALQDAGEQIRINQSFVNEAERNLRDSQLRQEVGVGTRFDVLRADVQLANALQSLTQSRFNQNIARRDISRLLNLPPSSGLTATAVARAESWPLDLEDSILLAFQNRSELEQQLRQADLNEQQRRLALAAIRPQVSLFAQYGVQTTLTSSIGTDNELDDSSAIGARFSWQVFDGGAARASARQREIAGAISEESFSENLDQIRFDVEQSFFNLQANEENISTSQVAVAQAEEALSLANLRLQAGVGTQLDVLTAQSELTQAQSNRVTAILGYNRSLASLQRAVSNLQI